MPLPEMCDICKQFMMLQICRDYNIPLILEHQNEWTPWEKQSNGDWTKTITTFIKPDFSKWDGKTGIEGGCE